MSRTCSKKLEWSTMKFYNKNNDLWAISGNRGNLPDGRPWSWVKKRVSNHKASVTTVLLVLAFLPFFIVFLSRAYRIRTNVHKNVSFILRFMQPKQLALGKDSYLQTLGSYPPWGERLFPNTEETDPNLL